MIDIDVLTMVMLDKEHLREDLNNLTLKELRVLIKKNHLDIYKPILKDKDRNNVIDYVIAEALRQMNHATII